MNKKQNKPNWLVIGIIAVAIFFFLRNQGGDDVNPTPSDWAAVERQVEKSTLEYAELLSGDMTTIAMMVDSGQINSKKELRDAVRKLTEKSRSDAFLPVGELDNKYIPDEIDGDNRELVEAYLRAKSRGHEKASK
jgi:hypothetical protein